MRKCIRHGEVRKWQEEESGVRVCVRAFHSGTQNAGVGSGCRPAPGVDLNSMHWIVVYTHALQHPQQRQKGNIQGSVLA